MFIVSKVADVYFSTTFLLAVQCTCTVCTDFAIIAYNHEVFSIEFSQLVSCMFQQFYEHLLAMLEDRGIDGAFCDSFVNFVTEYEHDTYIKFLRSVKAFTESK